MAIPYDESELEVIQRLWCIQFYSYEHTYNDNDDIEGELSESGDIIEDRTRTWYQASLCTEVYQDTIKKEKEYTSDEDKFFTNEFEN